MRAGLTRALLASGLSLMNIGCEDGTPVGPVTPTPTATATAATKAGLAHFRLLLAHDSKQALSAGAFARLRQVLYRVAACLPSVI
jgi:hypothetical protein